MYQTALLPDLVGEDVEHLGEMHALLKARLEELGRYEWALEDSAALTNTNLYEPSPASAWQRLKSVPFMPGDQQARARALAEWREERAVRFDKPRGWILSDKALLQMAEHNPGDTSELRGIDDLPPAIVRKSGEKLIQAITAANAGVASGELNFTQQFADRDRDKALIKKFSAIIRAAAEELGIAAEVVGSKRDMLALLRGDESARLIKGWRNEIVGADLLAAVNT